VRTEKIGSMSEAIREDEVSASLLEEAHRSAGAQFEERDGRVLPASYGDVIAEYESVRASDGAGVIDLSGRGQIEVTGAEAEQFLNGLITNDVKTLKDGAWMNAAFPTVQGRLIAFARVLRRDGRFLFDTEAATRGKVLKALERFTLAGDFHVSDLSDETAVISVQGARSVEIIGAVLGQEAANVERERVFTANWNEREVTVIRATHTAEDGFDLFVNSAGAVSLWENLNARGARPVGFDALEILRIEAGEPRYGADMDETNVVLEIGRDDAVSFTKGCYVGQEIIARIHWRGHVAKRLAGLMVDGATQRGDKIRNSEAREIGRITSAAFSPLLQKTIALGLVKYDYLGPGTEVKILSEETEHAAHVAELPFVRGGWYGAERSE